jgi:hypothetical protein
VCIAVPIRTADTSLFDRAEVRRENMSPKKKARRTRKGEPYSVGQINKLVDDLVHPFYEKNQWFRVVDGVLHGVVEGNARVSAKKFVKYNLPEIVRKILKKL